MTGRPILMVVCFPISIHAARWVNLVRESDLRIVVFHSILQPCCPEFEPFRTVTSRVELDDLGSGEVAFFDWEAIESVSQSAEDRRLGYMPVPSAVGAPRDGLVSPASLRKAIEAIRPDLVHSLELQISSYLCLETYRRMDGRFPTWLASSWGSDIYLYRKSPAHQAQLRALFGAIDALHSDCARDEPLARELGFRSWSFPAVAASGGVDLDDYPDPATLPPPSQRSVILVKGYHGWAGRGLHILLALHRIAPRLKGFRIRVTDAGPAVRSMAAALAREDGLEIAVDPYFPAHATAIARLAEARLAVGFGISDGISTTLLEAMAVGTFCIQADSACACEWIIPGVSSMVVPPHDVAALADAILRAATDDALVDAPVRANREIIRKRWTRASVAPTVLAGYQRLIDGPGVGDA